jgi:[ribosomal protein S5]-alanine N-acetyltransferase
MISPVMISTDRFLLKSLIPDDVGERYLNWLTDQTINQNINTAKLNPSLDSLKQYVQERCEREDVLFLGIFEKNSGIHIGNIKYEPVDSENRFAVMGILIGEAIWHGKKVAAEVISASSKWLNSTRNIDEIILGVARGHEAAIRAYLAAGFKVEETNRIEIDINTSLTMVLRYS